MKKAQWKMDSIIGPLYLVASEKGLQGLFWKEQSIRQEKTLRGSGLEIKIILQTVDALQEYFLGKSKSFDLPLDVVGTPFQIRVWNELKKIPYGKTNSYKDIATRLANPGASRAVGTANGRNPLSIIIPCHRVIAANGTLGGYAGGLEIKTKLLDLEQKSLYK